MIPYNCADYLFIYEFNGKMISFLFAFGGELFCRPIRITMSSILVADWLLYDFDEGCQSITLYRNSLATIVIG